MLRDLFDYAIARVRGVPTLAMLRRRGLQAGTGVHLGPFCLIDYAHAHLIELSDGVTLAPGVQIIAHDASTKRHLGYTRVARVSIGRNAFVGAGSIVMPGVRIGESAIVGAGSLVTDDVPAGMLAVGRPARVVGPVEDYLARRREELAHAPVFDRDWTVYGRLTDERRREMARRLADGSTAYVP
jgi:maltose O-acetyltransferase